MRLHKKLVIGQTEYKLVQETITLDLNTPGRAMLVLQSEKPVQGLVQLSLGYGDPMPIVFVGYVEQCYPMNDQQQRVLARELTAVLNQRVPLALRHCRARDILQAISSQCPLQWVLGDGDWQQAMLPVFHHTGGGYLALDNLGAGFNLPRYVWQQQVDGRVYVGSWDNIPWAGKTLTIPPRQLTKLTTANRATLPIVPQIRPGAQIQIGTTEPVIITQVEIGGVNMVLTWQRDPWTRHLKRQASA
jgi:hypothetical protein